MYYMLNLQRGGQLIVSELGDFLRKLRGGLSLREAAKRSGLSYTYIRSLELGKHPRTGSTINPTPEALRSLSKAYNYPHEELMKLAGHLDKETREETRIEETETELKRKKGLEYIAKIKDEKTLDLAIELLEKLAKE